MSDKDPYEAPKSKLDPSNQNGSPPSNSLSWKVFFWLTAALTLLGLLGIGLIDNLTIFDFIDLVLMLICTLGLYGFAYSKPISIMGRGVVFWRYFFYVVSIETVIIYTQLPLLGIPVYGQEWAFDPWSLVDILYMLSLLYAIYQYAYRRPFIWFSQR